MINPTFISHSIDSSGFVERTDARLGSLSCCVRVGCVSKWHPGIRQFRMVLVKRRTARNGGDIVRAGEGPKTTGSFAEILGRRGGRLGGRHEKCAKCLAVLDRNIVGDRPDPVVEQDQAGRRPPLGLFG